MIALEFLAHIAGFLALFICWKLHNQVQAQKNKIEHLQSTLFKLKNSQADNSTDDSAMTATLTESTSVPPISTEEKNPLEQATLKVNKPQRDSLNNQPEHVETSPNSRRESSIHATDRTENKLASQAPAPILEEISAKLLNIVSDGKWAVWIGGIALAFGAVFLIKYSIEVGLIGPKVRLAIAAIFGLALMGAGEYFRRLPFAIDISHIKNAYVPGILTAVGSMILFAVTYISYGVFGFISPAVAFSIMGILSLSTLTLALLHGSPLAAVGLLGSYVTPALVSTTAPNYTALISFLLIVTYSAMAIARFRGWVWLMGCAAGGALLWALILTVYSDFELLQSFVLKTYLTLLTAGFCMLGLTWELQKPVDLEDTDKNSETSLKSSVLEQNPDEDFFVILLAFMTGIAGIALLYVDATTYETTAIATTAMIVLSLWISAWIRPALSLLFAVGSALGLFTFIGFIFQGISIPEFIYSIANSELDSIDHWYENTQTTLLSLGFFIITIMIGVLGVLKATNNQKFETHALNWAIPASVVPLFAYAVTWVSIFTQSPNWIAYLGLLGTLALGLSSEIILKRLPSIKTLDFNEVFPLTFIAGGSALFAIMAVYFKFDGAILVVLSSFLTVALAGLSIVRPLQIFRFSAMVAAGVAIAYTLFHPTLNLTPSTTIIFNSLLPAYGFPALSFWIASFLLGKTAKDAPQRFFEGVAVLFTALLFTVQIRHGMNNGDLLSGDFRLGEQAAHTITALVLSGALMRLDDRSPSVIFRTATQILGYLSLAMVLLSHGLLLNPFFTNEPVGTGHIFNMLLIAYFVPGIIAAIVHLIARTRRPVIYVTVLELTSWVLLSGFILLTIRHLFVGEHLRPYDLENLQVISTAEAYTHSISLLLILLVVSFFYRTLFSGWKSRILPVAFPLIIGAFIFANYVHFSPLRPGVDVGEKTFFNLLLPGLLIPSLIFLLIRLVWKNVDFWQVPLIPRVLGGLAFISSFFWATLTVRHVWHGSSLYLNSLYSMETYAYSALWLALGVGILIISEWRNSKDFRAASAFFIFAAVVKVFLFDMSALQGGLRALSFIGLGLVLIGIGLFFQRIIFKDREAIKSDEADSKNSEPDV
ncbi:hypothetical protein NBRC116602_17130 [Hyphomicrobiales bacterium 4NK60-0047b]